MPAEGALDVEGLDVSADDLAELFAIDPDDWRAQLPQVREHFAKFGDDLPEALRAQLARLEERLGGSESA